MPNNDYVHSEGVSIPIPIYESYMVEDEIPTEGEPMTFPLSPFASEKEKTQREEKAREQFESETYAAKYPNAPQEVIMDAGAHLDSMFADPVGFWAAVAQAWTAQGGGVPSAEYAQWVRTILVDSIPPEHYLSMFNMLDLNHLIFVITHIFPEHWDYMNWRYIAGPDNRIEEWVQNQVNYMKPLAETGTEEDIFAFRKNILEILDKHRPDFMNAIPETLQIEFIRNFVPEILDAADKKVMDEKLKEKKAKTAMIWIGALAAGGLLFALAKGKGKAPGPAPGPVIISKG